MVFVSSSMDFLVARRQEELSARSPVPMEVIPPSSLPMSKQKKAENFDELAMQRSLLFSNTLKDLKDLRSELYSAAEYFERSFGANDHKKFVIKTLKEYAVKALINTVDHLGSVSLKINRLLEEKVHEVSEAELQVSCIKQRIRMCQELVDQGGLCDQSSVATTPKYHKHYKLPVGNVRPGSRSHAEPNYEERETTQDNNKQLGFQLASVRSTMKDVLPSLSRTCSISRTPSLRARSVSPWRMHANSEPSQRSGKHLLAERRAVSPLPSRNLLARSGSFAVRQTTLISSSSIGRQKSESMRLHAERSDQKDSAQNNSKGRRFLKSLLSMGKSKKDGMLHDYLDDY